MGLVIPAKCARCPFNSGPSALCGVVASVDLRDLAQSSSAAVLKRGAVLDHAFLTRWPIVAISDGVLSVQHVLRDGRKTISALLMPGDLVDFRGGCERLHGDLVALGRVEICRLSPDAFARILEDDPTSRAIAWNNMRAQIHRALDHGADIARKSAPEKLASFIFECRSRGDGGRRAGGVAIAIPIRRIDLADYLGMQPETVSRSFRDLIEHGIVEMVGRSIVQIIDEPRLRRLANGDRAAMDAPPSRPDRIHA